MAKFISLSKNMKLTKKISKNSCIGIISTMFFFGLVDCNSIRDFKEIRMIMGTYVEIQIWSSQIEKAREIINEAFSAVEQVDRNMSHYRPDSIISELNRQSGSSYKIHDRDTFQVIKTATEISKLSNGAFDITIGPLMKLWFSNRNQNMLPDQEAILNTIQSIGYKHYRLDNQSQTIFLDLQGLQFDLSAIAKGFAVDRAIEVLKKNQITRALVNAGGDLYALDPPPGKSAWNVGLRDPFDQNNIILEIPLVNSALATSGNYENFFEVDNKRYCHIIDPRTGYPVPEIASVTVKSDSAVMTDALATTFFVMGYPEGLKMAESMTNTEIVMIACENHKITAFVTDGFKTLKKLMKPLTISKEMKIAVCHD
ncbi:MAG: hypothetical protein A2161_17365 [Candidatus Schekmanbacteria bacterium RBG_13_48_7]|uniref:FAD:protein FMN transferase n=1 Tax=Candidatus Schekmanbacteria bacterium RBG_13_48_7 TaxID=1817878 RepID=A0A1F7RXD5_9BACT|nr:MAG: hypothetical protein A2161_17365 [Candidatus Schekmanbacteria bacterium RBG_13_48_7]